MEKNYYQELQNFDGISQNIYDYEVKENNEISLELLKQEYLNKYYAVWQDTFECPSFVLNDLVEKYKNKKWYNENCFIHIEDTIQHILSSMEKNYIGKGEMGVVIRSSDLRELPTLYPFFESSNDFPFDKLQESMIGVGTPLRVLGSTKNKRWSLVVTSSKNMAWILTSDIAMVEKHTKEKLISHKLYGVVRVDEAVTLSNGQFVAELYLGSIVAITGESFENFQVLIPQKTDNIAQYVVCDISKKTCSLFPLKWSRDNIELVISKLMRTPYDWGGQFQLRDCSATLKDYFAHFGVFLNRNSKDQIMNGEKINLLEMNSQEKISTIRKEGIPFKTLLYRPGHVMLYIGVKDDRVVVFHQFWKVVVRERGEIINFHEHKAEITYLDAGVVKDGQTSTLFDATESMINFII